MKTLLQDIMVFPEVTGAVVCDHTQGLLAATDLPAGISGKSLAESCQSLGRLFTARDTITNMEIHFTDSVLLVSPVSKTATLLTFCVPSANVALVNMTISMLLPNLQVAAAAMAKPPAAPPTKPAPAPVKPETVTAPAKAAAPAKPEPATAPVKPMTPAPVQAAPPETAKPAAPAKAAVRTVDVDAMLSTGPLARTLAEFQSGLAYAIGPVGEMVMRDAVGEWGKGGECSEQRLNELVGILCREIDDPGLEQEFREKITPFL